jgi:hypothetical protein
MAFLSKFKLYTQNKIDTANDLIYASLGEAFCSSVYTPYNPIIRRGFFLKFPHSKIDLNL